MKLHEKLRETREKLRITQEEVHERLVKLFGKNAISLSTIYRVEKKGNISKFQSVEQLAIGLGIPLTTLLKDTELEERNVIRKKDEVDHISSNKYEAKVLSGRLSSFLILRATLEPKGERPLEQIKKEGNFEKWIYVLKGDLTCLVGEEEFLLKAGDSIYFKSTIKHILKNKGKKTCEYLILQNPKHF